MRRDFTFRKRAILGVVIVLILADLALGVYSWQLASAPRTPEQIYAQHSLRLKLLKGDIDRGQKIRSDMPNTQKDCDEFEHSLFPASSGSSSVSAQLGDIAKKSGVRLEALSFKRADIASRGITEVAIDATVNGDYKTVIQFLNGVQRCANPYVVDSLVLATESKPQAPSNLIKVALHLKTYFRTSA